MIADEAFPAGIAEAARALRAGTLTAEALTAACLARIDALQPTLNAFITVTAEAALAEARTLDAERRAGRDRGPLHGIPIVHKDLYDTAGVTTTAGSALLRGHLPDTDAVVVRRLREAGAVMLGKTGMNELATGIDGRNCFFGDVRNPWDPARSPGGSSSGTAAAVAAGMALAGTGSDTGGSIRAPACWTGLTGLRPTHGLVSLAGAHPRSPSLDCGGPIAHSAEDCAILLQAMAGSEVDFLSALSTGVSGLRLGLVAGYGERGLDDAAARGIADAVGVFRGLGLTVTTQRIPRLEAPLDLEPLFALLRHEFHAAWGARWRDADPALFGPAVADDLRRGATIGASEYAAAQAACRAWRADFEQALRQVDALLIPAMPTTAPLPDAMGSAGERGRPFLLPVSAAGLPAIASPTGLDRSGLPLGMQLVGRRNDEATLLRLAHAHQEATGYHALRPRPG